ncbi:MAG TPA: DUF3667 domain-containing protein [Steroidobacteraceae bacterium]|nr:DUF3667 domain-containing protein [Steroidobacteraceae bacterium]
MSASAPLASAPPRAAGATAPSERCENCGNEVTQRYCGACGQRLEPPVHSLWHFSRLATEDLTHADSRLWRTLGALLFRPGKLTAEFLAGHRARYLPPLRLYLVVSVAFFLVASVVNTRLAVVQFDPDKVDTGRAVTAEKLEDVPTLQSKAGETPEQRAERVCAGANYDGPWQSTLRPLVQQGCRRTVIDNGRELQQAFLHNVPRAMFLFLPLLAALMMLMYWFPRHYYVEHLLLFVHNHAFVFLVAGVLLLLRKVLPPVPGAGLAVFLYFAWYMYRSMRVVYRQGRLLTLSKLALLACFYLLSAAMMVAATSVYSVLML